MHNLQDIQTTEKFKLLSLRAIGSPRRQNRPQGKLTKPSPLFASECHIVDNAK